MTVTPSGSTTNFSGVGAPNPKLTIPSLDQVGEPLATILRTIVAWLNNLSAPTGSGGYASLTGPGETATPGQLTQQGAFRVSDLAPPFAGIVLITYGPIALSAVGGQPVYIDSTGDVEIITASTASQGLVLRLESGLGADGSPVNIVTHSANPNGVVTSVQKGDLCVDVGTPGLWQSTAAASTVWAAL